MRAGRWLVGIWVGISVVILPGCATAPRSAPTARATPAVDLSGTIPWIDAPTTPDLPSSTPPPPPRDTDARPCAAGDVTAHLDGSNGAGGHLLYDVHFRNVSDTTCVLKGYPPTTAIEPGLPDVAAVDNSFFGPTDGTANMAPDGETLLGLETDTYCAARPGGGPEGAVYHRVDITMPGGGTISLDSLHGFDLGCGLRHSEFFVPRPVVPAPSPPIDALTAGLDAPPTAVAGTSLVYVVALTNPTENAIPLTPCPAYLQSAASGTTALVKDIEVLNCAPVGAVAAHSTVRFEMHMQLPADTPAGTLRIFWYLSSVVAKATVEVSSAPGGAK